MIKGIDVSEWQGVIDWAKVKAAGIEFAMIRSTYGKRGLDKYFKQNIEEAQAAGIKVGVYHYTYAKNVIDALAEADNLLNAIKVYKLEYPVAFDIEDPTIANLSVNLKSDIVVAFCSKMEQMGYWVMVYSSLNWFVNHLGYEKIKPYGMWLAQWGVNSPSFNKPIGIWQYSNKGQIDGISGNVDLDYSYVDYPPIIQAKGLNGFTQAAPGVIPSTPDYKSMYEDLLKRHHEMQEDIKKCLDI